MALYKYTKSQRNIRHSTSAVEPSARAGCHDAAARRFDVS